jgi:hypothetical protein
MDDFNEKGMSPARRRAESMLRAALEEFSFNREQEKQDEATAAKTARLRELRLAKEAAERDKESSRPLRRQKVKVRRRKILRKG